MRERALVHVAGPAGAGKTTFIERLLDAEVALAICIRAERDSKLRRGQGSAPESHAELSRYREGGASAVARYRFAEPSVDAFFTTAFMQDYSEAVFIEGDSPIDYVDLAVFVAPVPAKGHSLLRRVVRDHTASHEASIMRLSEALDDPDPAPAERWALEEGYEGIERAQLVVVNIRDEQERPAAKALLDELSRLRKDDVVFREAVGPRGNKLPITAVAADLLNPKDAGLKKAVARVKRATQRRSP